MVSFLPFFLVLLAAVFFSELFRRLHLPWVVALLLAGIVIGPFGLGVYEADPVVTFLGQIGLVFLMFMAGLETKLSSFREFSKSIGFVAALNSVIPFAVGWGIGLWLGFDTLESLLLGIIFVSSSIAVVIPSMEAAGLLRSPLGRSIVAATIVEDVASLVLLSILLQTVNPITAIPLPYFYVLLLAVLIFLRWMIPRIEQWFVSRHREADFHQEVRTTVAVLIGTVVVFEFLGLHPIIAGFFAGLVLSDTLKSDVLRERLHAISYGLFIPIFFIVAGTQADISVFATLSSGLVLVGAIVGGSMVAKFASGWLGGRVSGFDNEQSTLLGVSTIPQLSTTLAAVFAATELGLLRQDMITAMVVLSIVTTFMAPMLIRVMANRITKRQKERVPT